MGDKYEDNRTTLTTSNQIIIRNSWVRVRPNSSAEGSAMVRPGFGSAKGSVWLGCLARTLAQGFGFGQGSGSVRCSAGSAKNSSGSVRFGQNWVRSYPNYGTYYEGAMRIFQKSKIVFQKKIFTFLFRTCLFDFRHQCSLPRGTF